MSIHDGVTAEELAAFTAQFEAQYKHVCDELPTIWEEYRNALDDFNAIEEVVYDWERRGELHDLLRRMHQLEVIIDTKLNWDLMSESERVTRMSEEKQSIEEQQEEWSRYRSRRLPYIERIVNPQTRQPSSPPPPPPPA